MKRSIVLFVIFIIVSIYVSCFNHHLYTKMTSILQPENTEGKGSLKSRQAWTKENSIVKEPHKFETIEQIVYPPIEEYHTCDACGKSLRLESYEGRADEGIYQYTLLQCEEKYIKKYSKALYPYKVNRAYKICYPCYFKALAIKPDTNKEE